MKAKYKDVKFFPEIEYFWSLDSLNFSKLPLVSQSDISKLETISDLFYGQHDRKIFAQEESSVSGSV